MLTPERIKELDAMGGVSTPTPSSRVPDPSDTWAKDLEKIAATSRAKQRKAKETIPEKIGNFTGGTKLAQGLGQAIAAGKTNKDLEEAAERNRTTQGELIKRIKEKKAKGEDTSRLQSALQELGFDMEVEADNRERTLNPNEITKKEVIGDALQLGTTIASIGTVGKAAKGTGTLVKKAIPSAAKTLTKSGVGVAKGMGIGAAKGAGIGAAEGALYGTASGLKENKDAKGIAKSAALGAAGGAAIGGVVGGVTGGISGGIKASKLKKANAHLDAITPKVDDLPTPEYKEALRRGKIVEKTAHDPAQYVLSESEKAVATKYKHLLQGGDPVVNINKVMKEVEKKDTEVGAFLRKNNGIYNTGELKNALIKRLKDVDDITISADRIEKAKGDVIDNFLKSLKKNDMESLWKSRKEFDKFSKAFQGTPTFKKEMAREFRNAVQDFIADRTPDDVYKTSMKEMSELLNLADDNLTLKAVNERKLSKLAKWAKDNPNKAKMIWGSLAAAGLGIGGTAVASVIE
jgi:hypothetical protein